MNKWIISPEQYNKIMFHLGELRYGELPDRYYLGMICSDLPNNGSGPNGTKEIIVFEKEIDRYLARNLKNYNYEKKS